MDVITQAALGAAVAQAFLYQKDKDRAYLVGALSGMAADLDVLIRSGSDPMLSLLYHRHFTHSLLFIPLGGLIVALLLLMFPRFRTRWKWVLCASILGFATHGLLDACTSYGTVLYWPFSDVRVSFDIVSIVDPFFTVPLIAGLYWSYKTHSNRANLLGLMCAFLLLAFNAIQHQRAMDFVSGNEHVRVFPELASSRYWRAIWIANNQVVVSSLYVPVFGDISIKPIGQWPHFSADMLPPWVLTSKTRLNDFNIFNWFSDGYLIKVSSQPLMLADGRFIINGQPPTALWGVVLTPKEEHLKRLRFIPLLMSR